MIARALTIAGSDSGGGAGIQADLKTFTALKVFGMSVVTTITAQNTRGVSAVLGLSGTLVARQFDAVARDIGIDAAKTGMLYNEEIIEQVVLKIRRYRIAKLVVDPVMYSKSGNPLLLAPARKTLINKILPLALLVTPNIPEAEALAGCSIKDDNEMREAAKKIADLGPRCVLIKGGHASGKQCVDLLYDGSNFQEFTSPRIKTRNTHGTGCTLSAAITAYLARGLDVRVAVDRAKKYTTGAIAHALPLGRGHGPLNHFWRVPA